MFYLFSLIYALTEELYGFKIWASINLNWSALVNHKMGEPIVEKCCLPTDWLSGNSVDGSGQEWAAHSRSHVVPGKYEW